MYYYLKNLQEDIIGITDANFKQIVSYEYDPWGSIISIKDNNNNEITNSSHIGLINPFRYRSYYYDNETKLYYLNSRYYNPVWGRFLNCDSEIKAEQNKYNLYMYCKNNPINHMDNTGQSAAVLGWGIGGISEVISAIGAAVSSITTVALAPIVTVASVGALLVAASQVEGPTKKNYQEDKHTVYVLRNPLETYTEGPEKGKQIVEYVGRTNNESRRRNEHKNNPLKSSLRFERVQTNLSYVEARGLEEGLIVHYEVLSRGRVYNNKRHGISPKNPKYGLYMQAAEQYLTDETYVGGSRW